MEDGRFSHIAKDPRFRRMKKLQKKVKIDKRFEGMFKDKRFKLKYTVDKRGRPVNTTSNEDLQRFYELSDSDTEKKKKKDKKKTKQKVDNEQKSKEVIDERFKLTEKFTEKADILDNKNKQKKTQRGSTAADSSDEESSDDGDDDSDALDLARREGHTGYRSSEEDSDEESDSEDEIDGNMDEESDDDESDVDKDAGVDLARGEGNIETSSSSEEESSDDEDAVQTEHKWGELDADADSVDEATYRLALCNMDWDRIKAQDIIILLNSFKPTGGIIKCVTIYPSAYGLERMKEEDLLGPKELREDSGIDSSAADDSKFHREKLREYQLNRLKYYYAVVECDTASTANHIYSECDGVEYESSATKIDLRFIPDDMTFDQKPKDQAAEVSTSYKPVFFHNSALQQSHVNLTWDETDHDRRLVLSKKYTKEDLDNKDLEDYLASDSGDDEADAYAGLDAPEFGEVSSDDGDDDDEKQLEKYRRLLLGNEEKEQEKEEKDMGMEITWEPGLKESAQELVETKQKEEESLTPWEEYLQTKKLKKKLKQEKKKDGEKDLADSGKAFSDDDLPDDVDLEDEYFKDALDQGEGPKVKEKVKKRKGKKKQINDEEEQKELSLLTLDEEDNRQHFSLKKIMKAEEKKKKQRKKEKLKPEANTDTFQINVQDNRFSALYDAPEFNIDPSAPEYKKTKGMQAIIGEKIRKREAEEKLGHGAKKMRKNTTPGLEKTKSDIVKDEVSLLVKSVKAKTMSLKQKKNTKR